MWEIVKSGGWLMLPIIICGIGAMGIVMERFWTLRPTRVAPPKLVAQIWHLYRHEQLNKEKVKAIRASSPLGRILAAGLVNRRRSREVMKESIEEVGRQVVHELERYLNTLGTIAAVSPLLGLLGTVIGMIDVFSNIMASGVGNPGVLAGGISVALITTASGLSVAIPALMFHRYFNGLVGRLVIIMEEEALKMVEVMQGERGREAE